MKIHIETERLLMRDFMDEDVHGLFSLDSDSEVHKYLGNKPITTLQEARKYIDFVKQQYLDYGIGRWAVVEKESGDFIGWSGFKYNTETLNARTNYYDIGYRLIKKYWGKGYATETAIASLHYGFSELGYNEIVGIADVANTASNIILQKIGLIKRNEFIHEATLLNFYSLTKSEWKIINNQ
jgi:ribosomal-protein-alanine N-acetyltransferase